MAIIRCAAIILFVHVITAVVVDSFSSPCPPPRFDVFGENLVRSWTTTPTTATTTPPQDDDDDKDDKDTTLVVEEVMRSCGGAVQGIHEVPLIKGERGFYLNRANDGFLFLDNGTYTCGPVVVVDDDAERNEASQALLLFNFCISEISRLVVSADWSTSTTSRSTLNKEEEDGFAAAFRGILLRKTFGAGSEVPVPIVDGMIDPMSLCVEFSSAIQCSMPSFGQSWMLQRAKWEKHHKGDKNVHEQQLDSTRMAGPLQYWAVSQPIRDFCEWSGQFSPMMEESGHVVVHAGVLCKSSGRVQAIARTYGIDTTAASNKSLKTVSFLDGFARSP
jgi:hypothetical protein